jgi:hypothetical protein
MRRLAIALLLLGGCKAKDANSATEHAAVEPSLVVPDGASPLVEAPTADAQTVVDPTAPPLVPDAGAPPVVEEEKFEDELTAEELKGPLPKGTKRTRVLGGLHYRFRTNRGAVHVWVPPGYRSKTAGIVVYVHGYGGAGGSMRADRAWDSYKLAEQFKASRQNAIFIVPDAPTANEDSVKYPKLSELLRAVWRNTKLQRPRGQLVVIGHSGAFRTIVEWLDYRPLAHVILLDALFAGAPRFVEWLESAKGHQHHKLTMVGKTTAAAAESFLKKFKQDTIVRLKKVPAKWADMPKRARTARILYIRSQYGHMELVTNLKVIPIMLRRTPLKPL